MRALVKRAVDGVFFVVAAPFALAFHATARLVPRRDEDVFQGYSQLFSLWPGLTGNYLRRAFYRLTLRECPAECSIGFGTIFATPRVRLGPGVYVGAFGNIAHSVIGRDTLLGSNVTVLGGKHTHGIDRLDVPIRLQPGRIDYVNVGEDVWIGNGAIVAADVGDHAVVAAGAVVVKPVPAWAIVGGNPARVIGDRRERAARLAGAAGDDEGGDGDVRGTADALPTTAESHG